MRASRAMGGRARVRAFGRGVVVMLSGRCEEWRLQAQCVRARLGSSQCTSFRALHRFIAALPQETRPACLTCSLSIATLAAACQEWLLRNRSLDSLTEIARVHGRGPMYIHYLLCTRSHMPGYSSRMASSGQQWRTQARTRSSSRLVVV